MAAKKPFIKVQDKFTVFFAQNLNPEDWRPPESSFTYSKPNDTYYVNCKRCDKFRYDTSDLLDKNEIRNYFDFIHIAGEDKVFIGLDSQEQISNAFWNKIN